MQEPIGELMKMGTVGSIFLAVLLIALVVFAGWANQLINKQLKLKDDRITHLETAVAELQDFNQNKLMGLITDTHRILQKFMDTHERFENTIKELKRI